MIREILVDEEEAEALRFVASMTTHDGVGAVAGSIRQTLGFDLATFRAQGTADSAFSLLRTQAETAGIFVLLASNLGSHHSSVGVEAFRGLALADRFAPIVVVNDQDARSAWSFTLLHELTHLWLGATGVSGQFADGQLERFCNDVASQLLLPPAELDSIGITPRTPPEVVPELIGRFAKDRLVSRSMVAYRLFRAGRLTEARWRQLSDQFQAEWRNTREAQRIRNRDRDGPNYYVVRRHRLGPALLRLVATNMREGLLTPTKAAKLLGVKPRSVLPLLSGASLAA
jgi:Zn-dependent peptidase ImmA (M78 family)